MGLVVLLLAAWLVTGVVLLTRMELSKGALGACLAALGLGFVLRYFSLDHQTYDYIDFLAKWAAFFRDNGGFAAIRHPIGDYNVPYLYFMAAISYLPGKDLYLIKLFSMFFDLLLAFTALRLVRKVFPGRESAAAGTFCAVVLLPTVVLNGAYWGQCDSIYAAFVLLAVLDALDKRPVRSVVWLGLAFSFKLQAIFLIPLWCVFWYSGRVKFKHLLCFPAAYLASILPAWLLGKPMGDILGVYFNQMQTYSDRLTLNAPSLFALISYGVEVDGALWSKVGICCAFALVLAVLGGLFPFRKGLSDRQLLAAGLLLAIGVPLLLPHMHDRYFFLADVLAVVWCAGDRRRLPVPALVQVASLGGYHAYLLLRYAFPMAWGAWMMLAALVLVGVSLGRSLVPERQKGQNKAKK